MMNKELVHEIVGGIDPALVEEADEAVRAHKKHPPRLGRAGMIAACLCLVLAGTGAAAIANGWVRLSNVSFVQYPQANGSLLSIADVQVAFDGKVYVPWESFSQECRDFLGSFYGMPQYKGFDTWDELEEFLGLNIMDNPVLDRAEPVVHDDNSSLGGRTETGSCFVGFHGNIKEPDFIWLNAVYQLETHDNRHFYLNLFSSVETQPRESDERTSGRIFTKPGEELIALATETYITPSGLQTVIATTNGGNIEAFFQINSASFNISAYCDNEHMDEGICIVKEVLDAFS